MLGKFILTYIVLFLAWIAFTGSILYQELLAGALVSLLVSAVVVKQFMHGSTAKKLNPRRWAYFIAFLLYLVYREILAHLKLITIILSPRLKIKPQVVTLNPEIENELGLTALANSVTVTPGTLTIEAHQKSLEIHCIDKIPNKQVFGKSDSLLRKVVE
jgi:multicomponent Na+:H+ antiporter subunit E